MEKKRGRIRFLLGDSNGWWLIADHTGENRTMVAAATIVSMAAAKKAQQKFSLCTIV